MAGRNWATTSGVSISGSTSREAGLPSKGTGLQSMETRLESVLHSKRTAVPPDTVHLLGEETSST